MDTIVIGGGIAGLLTALRLARAGQEVTLIEADKLGSGATSANHGMLHSGALYVRRHGHIISACQESHEAFTTLLGDDPVTSEEVVYVVPQGDGDRFVAALGEYQIPHAPLAADAVPELPAEVARSRTLVSVGERTISSRHLIEVLAGQCIGAGVQIMTGIVVDRIVRANGRVAGVVAGADEQLGAQQVVLAAGLGTGALMAGVGSRHHAQLRSRLDMMLHFPRASLGRGLVFAEIDGPVVMPASGGGALASFFGGVQPQIAGRRDFAVDLDKASLLISETKRALAPGTVEPAGSVAYVAGKTDYVGAPHTENAVVNPGFHVIDHRDEGLAGLHTVITGKMTLGFHASRAVARAVLRAEDLELCVESGVGGETSQGLVAVEPWAEPGAI